MLGGPFGGKAQGTNECKSNTKTQCECHLKAITTAFNCFPQSANIFKLHSSGDFQLSCIHSPFLIYLIYYRQSKCHSAWAMIDTTRCPKVQHLLTLDLCFQLTLTGCPFANDKTAVLMRGRQGGGLGLLQDTQLIETLAHFSRERIPERSVSFPEN
jgi:hypothetical protein